MFGHDFGARMSGGQLKHAGDGGHRQPDPPRKRGAGLACVDAQMRVHEHTRQAARDGHLNDPRRRIVDDDRQRRRSRIGRHRGGPAFAEAEAAGNTNIVVIPTDSGTDAAVASASVEQLINDEVDVIIACFGMGESFGGVEALPAVEAALFAGELLRMYGRYAEDRGWSMSVTDSSETGLGGIKEAVAMIEGSGGYSRL